MAVHNNYSEITETIFLQISLNPAIRQVNKTCGKNVAKYN